MNNFEQRLHRTWLQLLVDSGFKEVAALALDGIVKVVIDDFSYPQQLAIGLPPAAYNFVRNNSSTEDIIKRTIAEVIKGRLPEGIDIHIEIGLLEVEEDWKTIIRDLIINAKNPNQGLITEQVFARDNKQPILYNEMKFGSQSEVRIAQEFEKRRILFFPLPLAVRNDTGRRYLDHREADFLVCNDGVWGILEVSYHPNRFEKDAEKDSWFKRSGILCIQHYSAERCFEYSSEVVDEFLEILSKHKR